MTSIESTTLLIDKKRGSALFFALVLVTILAALTLAFTVRIKWTEVRMESDLAGTQAVQVAQSASDLRVQAIWKNFETQPTNLRIVWLAGEDLNGNGALDPGEDINGNGRLDVAALSTYSDADWITTGHGQSKTTLSVIGRDDPNFWVDVRMVTSARVQDAMTGRWTSREFERVVRFGVTNANVFDFVYFANNYGWMYGNAIYIYGNMGANANIGLQSGPTVDGMIYAAQNTDLGALGTINGTARADTLDQYKTIATSNPLMRPTNPTAVSEDVNNNGVLNSGEDLNGNGLLDNYPYDLGYSGLQLPMAGQDMLDMPYLGDLGLYKNLAGNYARNPNPVIGEVSAASGGIVKQLKAPGLDPTKPENYNVIVSGIYGSQTGQNGMFSTVDNAGAVTVTTIPAPLNAGRQEANGNLALIGTPRQPIIVMGPVVVTNDLVIKGTITGQGTFYVGRNTHVVGDLNYANPPSWKQNDTNFASTVATNKSSDAVGFAAKGSVVLGNYTDAASGADGWNTTTQYMRPPFTQAYPVDATDSVNGYITGHNASGNPTFHGDYTQLDGSSKFAEAANLHATARKYYESTFSDAYIASIASKPTSVHGAFYTNHYLGGRVNQPTFYGSITMRDEGIVFDGSIRFSYDPRLSQKSQSSFVELFLPRQPMYRTLLWREIPAVD